MNRPGLKLICLLASIVIWIQVAATSTSVQSVNLPVRVRGLEADLTEAGSDVPSRVAVRMEGSKLMLLAHKYFNRNMGEVLIDLTGYSADEDRPYDIQTSDVISDATPLAVQPPVRVNLVIDRRVSRKLPVHLQAVGSLSRNLDFLVPPSITPDSVVVWGPERFFADGDRVQTSTIDLGQINKSASFSVSLSSPHGELALSRDVGRVTVAVAPLEERTMANLLVVPDVAPGQPEVGVSPPTADVMVRGVADSIRTLTRDRFTITVSARDLTVGDYVRQGVVTAPAWLEIIGLDPPQFIVMVGNPLERAAADSLSIEMRDSLE